MDQQITIFLGSFALVGFLLKTLILFNVEIKSRIAESFVVLCIFFIVQNVAEFLGYVTYFRSLGSEQSVALGQFFIHIYMIALYFIFPSVLLLALALTDSPLFNKARRVLYSISLGLTLAQLGGFVIAGFDYVGWTVITQPGSLYWLGMLYILSCAGATLVHLVYQYHVNKDYAVRFNCKVNLIAFAPLFAVAFGVLFLRAAGFNSSSAISLPLATIAFLFIMLLHTNGNLFWLTTKFKTVLAVLLMNRDASVDEIIGRIEKLRIEEALKVTNGQQKNAAALINLPPSTLNKKIAKYAIEVSRSS